jgi:hypothetical protein
MERMPILVGEDAELFEAALEQFAKTGASETLCNSCAQPIVFVQVSPSAVRIDCHCGKFKGSIRGL